VLVRYNTAEIPQNYLIDKILSRPQITHQHLLEIDSVRSLFEPFSHDEIEQVEILLKYDSYIKSEKENVEKLLRLEHYKLETTFDYNAIESLSLESRDKLNKIKPTSVGQASRISGVSPADISVLLVHFGR
jgi:tRNA uridine 5-carboxymethylaminomethyl modification enzyme